MYEAIDGSDHPGHLGSERVPSRLLSKLKIVDVKSEARTDASADGNDHNPVRTERREAEASDEIPCTSSCPKKSGLRLDGVA